MNWCSLVSLELEDGETDLSNFGDDIFVGLQGRFKL